MQHDEEQEYLTVKEIAAATGLSERRIQQLVKGYWDINSKYRECVWHEPQVPAIKRGRNFLVRAKDLPLFEQRTKPGGWRGGPRERREL